MVTTHVVSLKLVRLSFGHPEHGRKTVAPCTKCGLEMSPIPVFFLTVFSACLCVSLSASRTRQAGARRQAYSLST